MEKIKHNWLTDESTSGSAPLTGSDGPWYLGTHKEFGKNANCQFVIIVIKTTLVAFV